jgi:hypothetical protein
LLGFVNVWLIVPPEPGDAPAMLPLMLPIVQVNVAGVVADNMMFGLVALQIETDAGLTTTGVGFTVTTIE